MTNEVSSSPKGMTDHEARIAAIEAKLGIVQRYTHIPDAPKPEKRKPREWWVRPSDDIAQFDCAYHERRSTYCTHVREVLPPSGGKPRTGVVPTSLFGFKFGYTAVELTDEVREALLMAGISV